MTKEDVKDKIDEAVDEVKEAAKKEIDSAEVKPEIDDDSIGIDIESDHIKADIDVDKDGDVDVTINNRKFSFNVKGIDNITKFFFLPDGKVDKTKVGVVSAMIVSVIGYLGIA